MGMAGVQTRKGGLQTEAVFHITEQVLALVPGYSVQASPSPLKQGSLLALSLTPRGGNLTPQVLEEFCGLGHAVYVPSSQIFALGVVIEVWEGEGVRLDRPEYHGHRSGVLRVHSRLRLHDSGRERPCRDPANASGSVLRPGSSQTDAVFLGRRVYRSPPPRCTRGDRRPTLVTVDSSARRRVPGGLCPPGCDFAQAPAYGRFRLGGATRCSEESP